MDFETKRWAYETFKSALAVDSSPEAMRLLRYVNRAVGIEGDSDYQFDVASYRLASYLLNSSIDYPPYNCQTNVNTAGVQNFGSLNGALGSNYSYLVYTGGSIIPSQAGNYYEDNVVGGSGENGSFYIERDSIGFIAYISLFGGGGYQPGDTITIPSSLINDVVDIVINLYYGNGLEIIGAWQNCNSLTSFPLLDVSSGTNFSGTWNGCNSLTSFPLLDTSSGVSFSSAWADCNNLTFFPLLDTSSGVSFSSAWVNCFSLTSFPLLDTSSGVSFSSAWLNCTSLTSFPLIDTSSGIKFDGAWGNCNSLISFPLLNTSSGESFGYAWASCTSLTSLPPLNTSSGVNFGGAWANCTSLISFPTLDISNGTNFNYAWYYCISLTSFPAEMFNDCSTTNPQSFMDAWVGCALNQASVDNILVSLDASGITSNTTSLAGGTSSAPSATGLAAKASLQEKGWTILTN